MILSSRALATLTLLLGLSAAFLAFLLAGDRPTAAESQAVPSATSPNVRSIATRPGTSAISGVFSRSAPFFYVSGLDSVTVFDVSDPRNPRQRGKLVNAIFENEAMTLGERRLADGSIQRFVLLGNDLAQASPGPDRPRVGRFPGRELIVVDVTNPDAPRIIGATPSSTAQGGSTTGTHTVACMNAACTLAYSSGSNDRFSIFDLTDLTKPRQIKESASPAGHENPSSRTNEGFLLSGGHHWQVDGAGIAWHTGAGGAAAFDIQHPTNPQVLNATDENGRRSPYNDFIHHNSQRPNALAFRPGQTASVANGNVLLVTEEDYFNNGDETICSRAGSFQTWEVPSLDAAAYQAANPRLEPDKGNIRVLDTIQAPTEFGTSGAPRPAGGFCSAHWFDYHQSGIVAVAHYQAGLRLINVRDPRNLTQFGFAEGGGSEVWDAYWVPRRDARGFVEPGHDTNIVYTVDAVRGLEAFEVTNLPPDLPVTGDEGGRGTFPSTEPGSVGQTAQGLAGVGGGAGSRCGVPSSAIARSSRIGGRGLRLRGTSRAATGCRVTKVRLAIGRKVGSGCRFLRADGRFGTRRSCLRTQYITARGTNRWTLRLRARLPRGSYLLWSRAIDNAGTIERKFARRNLLRARIGRR